MFKTFCDRCDNEVKGNSEQMPKELRLIASENFHLCDDCRKELCDWWKAKK